MSCGTGCSTDSLLVWGSHAYTLQEKQVLRQVALPKEVYTGSCTQLFDFLAQTLATFIKEQQEVRFEH